MSLGIYISVPFCRSKCTYCNFASGVYATSQLERYVERVCENVNFCHEIAAEHGAELSTPVDSIYVGGGTPSLLPANQLTKLFALIANVFPVAPEAEITVECAPGTLTQPVLDALVSCGVNRVSLGVQSFVDKEAASVARLHTREKVMEDIQRLRACGISNINIDLIVGLPHQTRESWMYSLEQAVATDVPHVSVYMLEVDYDSRLGRELIAGGQKYHAHFVPDDDLTAELYETACSYLTRNRIQQYEISNFARPGFESRHNLKYWTRQPYLGFGVDAHSMLPASEQLRAGGTESVRLATTDSLDNFFASAQIKVIKVDRAEALEESFFLGLRLNRGVDLDWLYTQFGTNVEAYLPMIEEFAAEGLLMGAANRILLTARGRLLSNEVFERFIHEPVPAPDQ